MIAFPVMTGGVPSARRKLPPLPPVVRRPALRFSPTAWSKLLYWRDRGITEIGAFGVTIPQDPLLVTEVRLVRQHCELGSLTLDDVAVAEYFDEQVRLGRQPDQFARVWIRVRAGAAAALNRTDEERYRRWFGGIDWMVQCLLPSQGRSSARLKFHVGPGGSWRIPIEVDFRQPFGASAALEWEQEYREHIHAEAPF